MKKLFVVLFFTFIFAEDSYFFYGTNNKIITLTPITKNIESSKVIHKGQIEFYKTEDNQTIGIKNEITIALDTNTDIGSLQEKYNFTLKTTLKNNKYIVITQTIQEVFHIANSIHNEPNVRYAYPNYIRQIKLR
jgi:hypothetical protein